MKRQAMENLFKESKIIPLHQLGQNFLLNKGVINKIIKAADLKKSDVVLEIGTGTGILTEELAPLVKTLISIEKDKKLAELSQEKFRDKNNTKIVWADALKIIPSSYELEPLHYKIVANLPYSISGAFFRKFLNSKTIPSLIVVTVQKEVAERIMAVKPPTNLLSLTVQFYGLVSIVTPVKKEDFWPKPRVDSTVIKIKTTNLISQIKYEHNFFRLVRAGFSKKRKTILNALSFAFKKSKQDIQKLLSEAKIDFSMRAEQISFDKWITLATLIETSEI